MSDQHKSSSIYSFLKCILVLLFGFFAGFAGLRFVYIAAGILMWVWYCYKKHSTQPSPVKPQDNAKEQTKAPQKVPDEQFERVKSLNVIVESMWPYVTKYVEKFLRWRIQPLIRSRFRYLTNFHFFDIDFGKNVPQVTHMRVQSDPENKLIIVDLQVSYNAAVKVDVGFSDHAVIAGVNRIKLEGILKIVLAPLIPDVPFTGAVTLYFPHRPVLNLRWTGITNLLNIPGLQTLTERMILDQIANFMVSPKYYTQPLVANFNIMELPFAEPRNALRIHVLGARNLVANDFFSKKSDPYVIVRGGGTIVKTRVISKNLNPQWNQTFEILFSVLPMQEIEFEVLDKDVDRDHPLGSCKIAVSHVLKKKCLDKWLRLENVESGELHIKVETLRLLSDSARLKKVLKLNKTLKSPKNEELSSVVLYTYIERASCLPVIKVSQK
ncbi:hypothetical protein XENTR_v10016624 [Xenopus tropicalis]|nr:hypothetical protein XENTR_v10016624 [Xenopus tropicalis]KAE8597852.1 hypothetical protein XENTR_v10016624 [Xenopus tropicalis]KAE8597853.1 hypothetical protein XENTR_v10016624 [Xenopus tropicalis]